LSLPGLFDEFEVLSCVGNVAGSFGTLLSSELCDPFDVLFGVGNADGGPGVWELEAILNDCVCSFGGVRSSGEGHGGRLKLLYMG
jgi:hypothetical protein